MCLLFNHQGQGSWFRHNLYCPVWLCEPVSKGKSIISLVISPRTSLMQDQVIMQDQGPLRARLKSSGISAEFIGA
jgi:hypothetical protein